MIISRIIGGLGNQMFQYAFGRALALRHSTDLALDTSAFERYSLHNGYELSRIFNIPARLAAEPDYIRVLGVRGRRNIRDALIRRRYSWLRGRKFFVEPHYHYCARVSELPSDCYLAGYWQSEKYFKSAEDVIRGDFSFSLPISPGNQHVIDKMQACDAICMHIRRGDYVNNVNASAIYAGYSDEYYSKAIEFIANLCANPVLFVFSDDIAWAKERLKYDLSCEYIAHNIGLDSYNDMRLMSECRHNVIANSSFSWWGAWLNPRRDKIVIAPKNWFATNRFDSRDLMPPEWIRL